MSKNPATNSSHVAIATTNTKGVTTTIVVENVVVDGKVQADDTKAGVRQ